MPKEPYKSYIICTSPRSGSTLLCKLLAATGESGNPDSHFHNPSIESWLKTFNLCRDHFDSDRETLNAIFNAARKRGRGDTDFFGLRLQRASFDFFIEQAGNLYPGLNNDLERFQAAFGPTLFIHLTRQNKLNQAISLVIATQTGLWHKAADGTELERTSAPQDPVYDTDVIAQHLTELTALDQAWNIWFERENIKPLQITYDELSSEPTKALAAILDHLGLNRKIAHDISPPVAKLANATNQIWAKRFLTERGNRQAPRP